MKYITRINTALVALAFLFTASATVNAQIATYSGDLDGSNIYDRVWSITATGGCDAMSLDSGNDGQSYDTYTVTPDMAGAYTFETILGSLPDTYLYIYCSFDAANPMGGLLDGDDDGGAGFASLATVDLEACTEYTVVVSGYGSGDLGTYDLTVDGPAGATVDGSGCVAPPGGIALVPTMGEWSLFLFGLGMLTLGLVFVYNKQRQFA